MDKLVRDSVETSREIPLRVQMTLLVAREKDHQDPSR